MAVKEKNTPPVDLVEVKISENWVTFISFCRNEIPYGQICFTIANGEPVEIVNQYTKQKIRFDKQQKGAVPSTGKFSLGAGD